MFLGELTLHQGYRKHTSVRVQGSWNMAYLFMMLFALVIAGVSFDWEDDKSDDNNSL